MFCKQNVSLSRILLEIMVLVKILVSISKFLMRFA